MTRRRRTMTRINTTARASDYAASNWCYVCQAQLGAGSSQGVLKKHIEMVGHVTCSRCPLACGIFLDTDALDVHLCHVHGCERCPECSEILKTARIKRKHREKHENEKPPEIPPALILCTCGEDYWFEEIVAHWTESANHPTCSKCLVGFQDDFELSHHRRSCIRTPCHKPEVDAHPGQSNSGNVVAGSSVEGLATLKSELDKLSLSSLKGSPEVKAAAA